MPNIVIDHINLLDENLLSLADAESELHLVVRKKSIARLILVGVRGVKLETVSLGYRRYTSKEAIVRFLHAQQRTSEATTSSPK